MTQPKTLPESWPFSVSVEDQRGARQDGHASALKPRVMGLSRPSLEVSARRRLSPKRALIDLPDAPF